MGGEEKLDLLHGQQSLMPIEEMQPPWTGGCSSRVGAAYAEKDRAIVTDCVVVWLSVGAAQ